jgi:peptidoglycan hydrolase CwlO-like protein
MKIRWNRSKYAVFVVASVGIFSVLAIFSSYFLPSTSYSTAHAQELTAAQKAKLEKELAQVEAEQKQAEAALSSAQAQSSSLQRDIAVLDAKIKVAQLNIRAKNLLIESLGKDIKNKEAHIGTLDERIERGRDTLAVIMRKTNEVSSYSLPEVLLSQSTVSGVLNDLDTLASVQESLKSTFEQIRSDKSETQAEKSTLEKRRNTETDARYSIQQEEKNIKTDETEKRRLLTISKGNEAAYQADLAQKRLRAAEIRAALFPLRGSDPIPFGTAYGYAVEAERKTGVRAAFLLGIFAQESSLDDDATFGKQIGSCYMTDPATGNGRGANTGSTQSRVMHPTRDVPPFLTIVKALNGDPSTTRVSCWQPVYDKVTGEPIGWGGAMGPAQFIPSTWILYVDNLRSALGISSMPSPWNPAHAFMAASMLLKDNGAAGQTYTTERNAACKYFSGKACPSSGWILTYGNSAMANAEKIQRMINELQ